MRKLTVTLGLMLAVALTAYAYSRCATIDATASQPQIQPGFMQLVALKVSNCGNAPANLITSTTVTTACGEVVELPETRFHTQPGGAFFASIAYPVPANACLGTYTIDASVRVGNTVLDMDSATFEVIQ